MSLLKMVKKCPKIDLFTTPSHSQSFAIYHKLRQFYKYDISETDAYEPQEALELSQIKASEIYKTKQTLFLTNGSTGGVITAVLTCVKQGEKVLIWDNAHPSHANAVKLAGAIPVYYKLDKDKDWGIYKEARPEDLEKHLSTEKPKAIIVTSPSYEGIVSDIKAINEICKKYGTYLIVDEAHGALYPFSDKLPTSTIYQGADFVIQSLHKTAGGLNPTALLHNNTELDTKPALSLINTTSPSYPILASIEKNINYLNSKKGKKQIDELLGNIENMKKNVKTCEFYEGENHDPTKILIKCDELSGEELSEFLYKNNIEDEKTNEKSTMLLCGIGAKEKKLKRLERVLKKI